MRAGDFFATDLIISIKKVKLYPDATGYELRFDYDSGTTPSYYEPNIIHIYREDLEELKQRLAELEVVP